MSLTILLEIGHDASLRPKISPEGFTHDWEVFVKGQNNAEIHYYVEKVVFYLHETFPKPKRVIKEPPFSLRTSGYAGFKLPIEIYLKNNQEPKRIKFNYDLDLQPNGPPIHIVQKEKYTFFNPSEEFRSKLLKGGAVEGSGKEENSVNRVSSEEKNQMTSKPKLSGSDITKKHKMKYDEPRNTDFENLFGPPIKKNSKLPEQPKPREPAPPPPKTPNLEKVSDKDKNDKSKSNKSIHKDKEKEKPKEKSSDSDKKNKEEKKKSKDEKSKDRDRSKEKSSKKEKEREKSPMIRPRSPSPKRSPKRDSSPPPVQKHTSSTKEKESIKEEKKEKDREKDKKEDKKSKKDKRDHKEGKHKDREKDKEHKEHKSKDKDKESKSSRDKESSSNKLKESSPLTTVPNSSQKTEKKPPKDKEQIKEQSKEQEEKIERIEKSEKPEKNRQGSEEKDKEKDKEKERQNKHKHKKKDRKEKKEEKHSKKEERKNEKQSSGSISNSKDVPKEPIISVPATIREVDKSNLFGSPKSDSALTPKESEVKTENNILVSRDDESSNDSVKVSSREASPPAPRIPSKSPSPPPPHPEPVVKKPEPPEKKKESSPKKKDKKEKKKDKKVDKDHEKRRKRKSDSTVALEAEPPEKITKVEVEENNSDEESKVSSTEDTTTIIQPKSECDMDMLRELQHKIMSLKDSADLQRVVQLIAETGQYEVSAHTFDFDLCLLDRSTVRQLQDFFSTIS